MGVICQMFTSFSLWKSNAAHHLHLLRNPGGAFVRKSNQDAAVALCRLRSTSFLSVDALRVFPRALVGSSFTVYIFFVDL